MLTIDETPVGLFGSVVGGRSSGTALRLFQQLVDGAPHALQVGVGTHRDRAQHRR